MHLFTAYAVTVWVPACSWQSNPEMVAEFEAAKAAALAAPSPAPTDWSPDAVMQLSPPLVEHLVRSGLEAKGALSGDVNVPGVTFTPELQLKEMELMGAPACDECVKADLSLEGVLKYDASLLVGEVPMSVQTVALVELGSVRTDDGWDVTVKPRALRKIRIDVAGLPRRLMQLGEEPLRAWAEAEMVEREPERVTHLGGEQLPLRDLRVASQGAVVKVELLTQALQPQALTHTPAAAERGWQLEISTASLVSLARREAFARGPQTALKVVAVPERLAVTDETFELDLRLWHLDAPSWWRDLRVSGSAELQSGRATFVPSDAERLAASEGAGWADPLLTLAEGALLSSIASTLEQSVPAAGSTVVKGAKVSVDVKRVRGTEGGSVLELKGGLKMTPQPTSKKPAVAP
ncbi:MAG: hypothetical protein KTR31_01065 [Myxococcales bacterium]|nr:hypothetical protein [Myxococcales bacterium]